MYLAVGLLNKEIAYKELGEMNKYKLELTKLRCAGSFKHNIKILSEGSKNIVVVKRPSKKRKAKSVT